MRTLIVFLLVINSLDLIAQDSEVQYLSGLDKDRTVDWQFNVSGGRNSGEWKRIPVPSNWEMQGFGTYRYWSDLAGSPAPDSIGIYKLRFEVPASWKSKTVKLFFGGVMTDARVEINGTSAGPIHQGGFYEFQYDISGLLNYGVENLLTVEVKRFSSDVSINNAERRADFWLFSGIYRPVWLEASPKEHVDRIAINADHNGNFAMEVFAEGINASDYVISACIKPLSGKSVMAEVSEILSRGQTQITLKTAVENVKPWSAEWPHLYEVEVKLLKNNILVHRKNQKFGFRTIEIRKGDGVYVNDTKIRLRGTNRHSFWPTSGRTTSRALSIVDVNLIKDMNMNAVRMSHYPPDKHFLEITDSLGLYVINELTGWQDKYNTEVGKKLVRELIIRDVNHPSILFWANGNEGGWNRKLDEEFAKWDPQQRPVLHPWETFSGINTSHYEVYDCCAGTFFHGNALFMPTEFLHGLYDGGNGAGLDDWWNLMLKNPLAVGGFLWAYADEGIVRDDRNGAIDVAGNRAPDGIVGPFREKEGSFYTIKEVWSPVYLELSELDILPTTFDGKLKVENRFDHTNLSQLQFIWELVNFPGPDSGDTGHETVQKGMASSPDVLPHESGTLSIKLPSDWMRHDALYLTALDSHGRNIYTWTWMIAQPGEIAEKTIAGEKDMAKGMEREGFIRLKARDTEVHIDAKTGTLSEVFHKGKRIALSNGPRLVFGEAEVKGLTHHSEGDDYVVETMFEGDMAYVRWKMLANGWLKLDYQYRVQGTERPDVFGVTFNYPEEDVTGMKWLGKGPYRVWKNRLKGAEFDVWQKNYNNAVTGLDWEYPEFKGFHSSVYWTVLESDVASITMLFDSEDMFLRVFTPLEPEGDDFDPRFTHVDFPAGDISFLDGIAPIGTKFYSAESHGPSGQPHSIRRHGRTITRSVYFYFN